MANMIDQVPREDTSVPLSVSYVRHRPHNSCLCSGPRSFCCEEASWCRASTSAARVEVAEAAMRACAGVQRWGWQKSTACISRHMAAREVGLPASNPESCPPRMMIHSRKGVLLTVLLEIFYRTSE